MPTSTRRRSTLAAALVVAATLTGCSAVVALLPAPPPSAASTAKQTATGTVSSLAVGDCLNDVDTASGAAIPVARCASQHGYEVYAVFPVPGDAYPGDDPITAAAESGCAARFDAFTGIAYRRSSLDFSYLTPTEASWTRTGDHVVTCLIYDPAGVVAGSLAASAR